jgi:hypothetical protein
MVLSSFRFHVFSYAHNASRLKTSEKLKMKTDARFLSSYGGSYEDCSILKYLIGPFQLFRSCSLHHSGSPTLMMDRRLSGENQTKSSKRWENSTEGPF